MIASKECVRLCFQNFAPFFRRGSQLPNPTYVRILPDLPKLIVTELLLLSLLRLDVLNAGENYAVVLLIGQLGCLFWGGSL
jgi:hypothetical protein